MDFVWYIYCLKVINSTYMRSMTNFASIQILTARAFPYYVILNTTFKTRTDADTKIFRTW